MTAEIAILCRVSGMYYINLIKKHLFIPSLGMKNASQLKK